MVVDGNSQLLLGLVLTDNVLVQKGLDLGRLRKLVRGRSGLGFRTVIFENRVADRNAFVADVSARIVSG
jgi:hypothetical protein